MTDSSSSVRAQMRRDVLNGIYDALFERRFGIKPGTIAASQKSRQVIDGAGDIINKNSIPVVTSSEESDFQKNLQRQDGSLKVV